MKLEKCQCGNNTFEKRTKVVGTWVSTLTLTEDGRIEVEGNGDSVRNLTEPKTVRCEQCGKRHPNPDYI